jgi:hypothetical protein
MATRYWVAGGNGLWSSTTNWSATTGGTSGASVPTSADRAQFNSLSGSGTATVDSNVTINDLLMGGFTGTLAFGTNTISVAGTGNVFNGDNTFTVTGTPVINVTSTGSTAITVSSVSPASEANSISFNFTGGTYALTFLNALNSTARNVNFTGFAGTWSARTQGCIIYGSLTLSTGLIFPASTGSITFGATSGTQNITFNGKTFNAPFIVNAPGATVRFVDTSAFISTQTLNNGTFDANGQVLVGAFTIATGSVILKGVTQTTNTINFTQSSGTVTLGSACNTNVGTYTLTAGTLDLAGFQLTTGSFLSSNSNVRTIAFGSGNITCVANGTVWNTATVTNLTVTGTPVVNVTSAGSLAIQVSSGALSEANSISFNFTSGTYSLTFLSTASDSAKNVDFTGFAGTWAARTVGSTIYGSLTLSTGMTFATSTGILTFGATSGTQIITSNGKTIDEPLTVNGVGGTVLLADALTMGSTRTLTLNNGTFDANNKTVSGMTAISSNLVSGNITVKNLSTSVPYNVNSATINVTLGTNISVGVVTLTAGTINFATYSLTCTSFSSSGSGVRVLAFGTGNITITGSGTVWNTTTNTNLTYTGTSNIIISNNTATATTITTGLFTEANALSFNIINGTYALLFSTTTPVVKNLNFVSSGTTGFGGTVSGQTGNIRIYGDLTLSSNMTLASATSAGFGFLKTTGTQTVTSNGVVYNFPLYQDGVGGTMKLIDALTMLSTRAFSHNNGTLDLNGQTMTVGTQYLTNAGTKNITFNGGTLVCPAATTTAFNNGNPIGFTTTAGTGTGYIRMTGATAKTFVGGDSTYNCTLSNDGAGALTISGANTFTTIANGVQPTSFVFPISVTQTLTNWNVNGTAGNLVTITSGTAGTAATLSKASGTVSADYLSLKDSAATGGAGWYAGTHSTNVSGNSGWIFTAPPVVTAGGNFFFMF